jgi:sugar O-acyltransferase (sialic acid O-acetyltransferase NeuD family)
MEKIVIYGNKSLAREFFFCLKYFSDYEVVGFTVDRELLGSSRHCNLDVIPFDSVETVFPPDSHKMLIAVGYVQNNKIRKERYFRSKEMGYELINFTSPKAIIHPETAIGDNCFIDHYVIIPPDVTIGNNVIIRSGCNIGHDVVIGDHCFFSPGVSIGGTVNIGPYSFFGMSSIVRNKVSIGKECVIGAGALILESAEDRSVYLGEQATKLPILSCDLPLG